MALFMAVLTFVYTLSFVKIILTCEVFSHHHNHGARKLKIKWQAWVGWDGGAESFSPSTNITW